jgi:hypothetical protein
VKNGVGMLMSAVAVGGGMLVVIAGLPLWWLVPLLGLGLVGISLVGR